MKVHGRNISTASFAASALTLFLTGAAWSADMQSPASTTAPDPAWFVKVGPGAVLFDSSTRIKTPLGVVPGASAVASNNVTGLFEVGYFFNKNFAASLTGGFPPTTKLTGRGTAAPLGTIGEATYGPALLTAHYHIKDFGAFQPYAGLGAGYGIIFDAKDGAVTNLSVKGAPIFVLQGGFDVAINKNWGVYFDAKKLYLSVDASGNLGPTPITAKVKLDPVVLSSGLVYRF